MRLPSLSRRHLLLVVLVATLALAGCQSGDPVEHTERADPGTDRLGWEAGYWHDDPVTVDATDGYNASERDAVVARTMARVEQVRGLEFQGTVPVSVVSRAEYRNRSSGGGGERSEMERGWHGQTWEAPFIVGEDTSPQSAHSTVSNQSVQGYYDTEADEIVLVGNTSSLDTSTLAHELTHAAQDQHFDITREPTNYDAHQADTAVVEGDADLVQSEYDARCGDEWACLGHGGGSTVDDVVGLADAVACSASPGCRIGQTGGNYGYRLTVAFPYVSGQAFVEDTRRSGNWSAVNDLYGNRPASTEQVIHPEAYPHERPENVTVSDRSSDQWRRYDHDPETRVVGESVVAAMVTANELPNRTSRYETRASSGWAGDTLVPYHNGSGGSGYVWVTAWDSERDAREFADAYRSILTERGNATTTDGVYVIPESDPFADAFRVTREGDRVTIVNAPTREALPDVRASR